MRRHRREHGKKSMSIAECLIKGIVGACILFVGGMLVMFERSHSSGGTMFQSLINPGNGGGVASLRQVSVPTKPLRLKVAFAITITKDGNFQDGAAVLAYSIHKAFEGEKNLDLSLVAFVHPNVTTSRGPLTQLGYHVIEVPTPINVAAIKFEFLREHIDKNGCCGAAELIKISSYRLLQYDRVVHLDADVEVIRPFMRELQLNKSLVYTTDPNMASHKGADKMPVQGGFLIIRPSMEDYNAIIDTIMTTKFFQGGAWGGSKIGWFWGGMTVQGILPYYYRIVSNSTRMEMLDRCYFNTMADVPECITQQVDDVFSAHFTVCQKPWACYSAKDINPLCGALHDRWFDLRRGTEAWYGVPVTEKACPKFGHKHYKRMQLDNARLPPDRPFFVPDTSPDLLAPTAAARF